MGLAELLDRHQAFPELTTRQQVLSARARGESFTQLATRLYISVDTAKDHIQAVNRHLACYLQGATAAELAHQLRIAPGDLVAHDQRHTPSPLACPVKPNARKQAIPKYFALTIQSHAWTAHVTKSCMPIR